MSPTFKDAPVTEVTLQLSSESFAGLQPRTPEGRIHAHLVSYLHERTLPVTVQTGAGSFSLSRSEIFQGGIAIEPLRDPPESFHIAEGRLVSCRRNSAGDWELSPPRSLPTVVETLTPLLIATGGRPALDGYGVQVPKETVGELGPPSRARCAFLYNILQDLVECNEAKVLRARIDLCERHILHLTKQLVSEDSERPAAALSIGGDSEWGNAVLTWPIGASRRFSLEVDISTTSKLVWNVTPTSFWCEERSRSPESVIDLLPLDAAERLFEDTIDSFS